MVMAETQSRGENHKMPLKAWTQNWHPVTLPTFNWIQQDTRPDPTSMDQGKYTTSMPMGGAPNATGKRLGCIIIMQGGSEIVETVILR